jgi:CO/xanthine dehydrogenase FAD-binding subunit
MRNAFAERTGAVSYSFDVAGSSGHQFLMAVETLVPATADEAATLFGDGEGITVVAGGTILMPLINAGHVAPTRALLLHRSGLDAIETVGAVVRIGATATLEALSAGSEELLSRFASEVADGEVRRAATLGGNLCAPPGAVVSRGDLGAPLVALGARVRSTGAGGERTEPIEDFLAGSRSDRLVLGVEYDDGERRVGAATMRRRHAHSYSIANVAVCERPDGLRIGISGVGDTAVRCRTVEASRDPVDVLRDVEPVDDALATAAYRREILPLLVRRALDELETR